MFVARMRWVTGSCDSLQDLQLAVVIVRLLCDYDFDRNIYFLPNRSVSVILPNGEDAAYTSSRVSQTVENDPKPSLLRIRYRPSQSRSLR